MLFIRRAEQSENAFQSRESEVHAWKYQLRHGAHPRLPQPLGRDTGSMVL